MLGVKTLRDNANRKTLAEILAQEAVAKQIQTNYTESSHSNQVSALL